jgi:hypothetical protein
MKWGTRAQFYRDFMNTFRKGDWGEEAKLAYETMTQGAKTNVKDIIRAMSEEKVAELTRKPLITKRNYHLILSDADAFYNLPNDRIALGPVTMKDPGTIAHEARHAQQFRPRTSSIGTPIWLNDDMYNFYHSEGGGYNYPVGKIAMWDFLYGNTSNAAEVDALLSEMATNVKARSIADARKIKKTGSAATPTLWRSMKLGKSEPTPLHTAVWEGLSEAVKEHYLKTASIAGLGFLSEPKLQGEEED